MMKVSDFIAKFLHSQGVEHVFELSGGMITHLLDSIYNEGKIKIVTMHHEQSAAFAADGYARICGIPGVALATSGPGATNLLTGIGSCYFDSVPAVFITGQVNVYEQKGSRNVRQLGFQETDIAMMARPVTKAVFSVKSPEEVPTIFKEAFRIALSDRPGPVLIDIPMNIQRDSINYIEPELIIKSSKAPLLDDNVIADIHEAMLVSEKPLILAGRGILSAKAQELFKNFTDKVKIPVVSSLLAIDVLPCDNDLKIGLIGTYGNRWANLALADCDFLLVLGSRLDIRQTGADVDTFRSNKKIFHIDVESDEINNRVKGCYAVNTDVYDFLSVSNQLFKDLKFKSYATWLSAINQNRDHWPDTAELVNIDGVNPNLFVRELSKASVNASVFLADVGSHQMWVAQSLQIRGHQRFITSGGMGAMGYALPASIGAAIAANKPVVTVSGDGGFQLNIQEIETIVRNNLPVKMVIMNNKSLGMIRQFQDSYFNGKHQSTVWGYSSPDFCRIAEAYGVKSYRIEEPGDVTNGLRKMWESSMEPFLLEVMIDPKTNVYPKIAFGRPISEMEPFYIPSDVEST